MSGSYRVSVKLTCGLTGKPYWVVYEEKLSKAEAERYVALLKNRGYAEVSIS